MSTEELLIKTIRDNTIVMQQMQRVLEEVNNDYCYTEGACRILGIKDERELKWLRDMGFLFGCFAKRGRNFIYKKKMLYPVADKLDKGTIVIPPRHKR